MAPLEEALPTTGPGLGCQLRKFTDTNELLYPPNQSSNYHVYRGDDAGFRVVSNAARESDRGPPRPTSSANDRGRGLRTGRYGTDQRAS